MLDLNKIVQWAQGTLLGENKKISGFGTDTRTLNQNEIFVAIQGEKVDSHTLLSQAKAKGAVAALVEKEIVDAPLPLVRVDNTILALGKIAHQYRRTFSLPIAALTGSCGKTTVKEMIACILGLNGNILATQGNLNTEIGVPLTLMRLNSKQTAAVIEMGARKKGDIAYLMGLVAPSVALITNAGVAHIEVFGSEMGIAKAKGEIYENLKKDGIAIINEDDPHKDYWKSLLSGQKLITFGFSPHADIRGAIKTEISSVMSNHDHIENMNTPFTLQTPKGHIDIDLPVPGKHSVENALAAAAVAFSMGSSLADIKKGLESFTPVKGRMQFKPGIAGVLVIDDTYNANPVSMRAALNVLANRSGKKIFVMADMLELGERAALLHAEIGTFAKQLGIEKMLGLGALTRHAVETFGRGATHYADKASLINALSHTLEAKSTVLIKGSRSMRMEEVVEAMIEPKKEKEKC